MRRVLGGNALCGTTGSTLPVWDSLGGLVEDESADRYCIRDSLG